MHASHQQYHTTASGPATDGPPVARPPVRRLVAALAWLVAAGAVFTLLLLITRGDAFSSDPANNALQAWDMLHGHLLLHGWILGDVTFYTFELPLIALAEAVFGLSTTSLSVAMALIYLAVTACSVALAVTGSRAAARVARAAVTLAVLVAPILVPSVRWVPLGLPDHTGTTVFLLLSVLLIDRLRLLSRWITLPLLCVLLAAGQLSDVTVRYVFISAIAVVCLYRMLADRRVRTADGATLAAVVVSIPLSLVVRAVLKHLGSYLMVTPKTELAPLSAWPHNAELTWHALRMLFGQVSNVGFAPEPVANAVFGACCMLAVAAGLARVLWRWRTASRAEQLLAAVIVINIASYLVSTLAAPESQHDLVAVLPAGAVLAARALVPERLPDWRKALAVCTAAVCVALIPLGAVAVHAKAHTSGGSTGVDAWLQSHGLRYGLAGYWAASIATLESGGQVRVRTVVVSGRQIHPYYWEADLAWYDPAQNYANFVLVNVTGDVLIDNVDNSGDGVVTLAEKAFGQPAATHRVGNTEILIYHKNLLKQVTPGKLPGLS
jgi:hypothetical protein